MNILKLLFFINILIFNVFSYSFYVNYVPAAGILQFYDFGLKNGIITSTLLTNQEFKNELKILQNFETTQRFYPQQKFTYQENIDHIINSQTPLAMQVLTEVYSKVIMHIYYDKAYVFKLNHDSNIFIKGLRANWLNLLNWIDPSSWVGENNLELEQLIREYDQLANIASSKNPLMGQRMKLNVFAYKHWKFCYCFSTLIISWFVYCNIDNITNCNNFLKSWLNGVFKNNLKNKPK